MNDTKSQTNKQTQKNQRQTARPDQGSKKQGQNPNMRHQERKFEEHEHPELRMTR